MSKSHGHGAWPALRSARWSLVTNTEKHVLAALDYKVSMTSLGLRRMLRERGVFLSTIEEIDEFMSRLATRGLVKKSGEGWVRVS